MADIANIKAGDQILFRAQTLFSGKRKINGKVIATWPDEILVKALGRRIGFVVKPWEILEHFPAQEKGAEA